MGESARKKMLLIMAERIVIGGVRVGMFEVTEFLDLGVGITSYCTLFIYPY